MNEGLTKYLNSYVNDCRALEVGLQDLLEDIDFVLAGGTIRYAIDFAEIYSYVFPQPDKSRYFSVFADEMSDADNAAFERLILKYILYEVTKGLDGKRQSLVLLRPYLIELETFVRRTANDDFDGLLRHAIRAFEETAEILDDDDFKTIFQILNEDKDQEISAEDEIKILELMDNHAASISSLLSPPSQQPLVRLKKLLNDGVFCDLSELLTFQFILQNPQSAWWYDRMVELRGERSRTSARIDATAVSIILQVNERYEQLGIKTRLRLITRSLYMHQVYKQYQTLLGDTSTDNMLRHPRMFNIISLVKDLPLEVQKRELKDRLTLVRAFVLAATNSSFPERVSHRDRFFLGETLARIRADWVSKDRILAAARELSRRDEDLYLPDISRKVRQFIFALKTRENLREIVINKLDSLHTKYDLRFDREQTLLGIAIQTATHDIQEYLFAQLNVEIYGDKYVLRTNSYAMPCTLQIFSTGARSLINLFTEKHDGWMRVLEFFRSAFTEGLEYERLLVMAYILGAMNKWELAETYTERSLVVADMSNVPRHEGYFFQAVCMRKRIRSIERHLQAIKSIKEATKLKRQYRNDSKYDDPRFLKEIGTHILIMHIYYASDLLKDVPTAEEGIALLLFADTLCRNDERLRAQIRNNLLDYEIDRWFKTGEMRNIERLRSYYASLLHELNRLEGQRETLRPATLDTMAIARWVLFPESFAEKEELLEMLDKALLYEGFTREERTRVEEHKKLIARGIRLT